MRDYDLRILIFFFDLEHLCKIHGIAQAKRTRNVKHYLRAELVAHLQVLVRQKVEDTDFGGGNVRGRIVEIRLYSAEAALGERFADILGGGIPACAVKRRKTVRFRTVYSVLVYFLEIAARPAHEHGLDRLSGKHLLIGFHEILDRAVGRDKLCPVDHTLAVLRLVAGALHAFLPYMNMDIDHSVGQKIPKILFIYKFIILGYVYPKHSVALP